MSASVLLLLHLFVLVDSFGISRVLSTNINYNNNNVLIPSLIHLRVTKKTLPTTLLHAASPFDGDGRSIEEEEEDDDDDDKQYHEEEYITSQTASGSSTTKWTLPNDFETFLNQCTIQSFLYLLKTCRDPQTVLWIEQYTQPAVSIPIPQITSSPDLPYGAGGSGASKLLSYHGLGAINIAIYPTWDTYFTKLLEKPCESHIIESTQAYIPNYELDINPPSLCSRMISVREQIAREFVKDLSVIATMGGNTLEIYWDNVRRKISSSSNEQQRYDSSIEGAEQGRFTGTADLLFLELNANEVSDHAPSPLRAGNFDLLTLLTMQEAIHRVLNNNNNNNNNEDSEQDRIQKECNRRFLLNFYMNRLLSHFTGRQRYGQADRFIQELLNESPSIIQIKDNISSIIDPIRIAELILMERSNVALEWKEIALNVPNAHVMIKRLQLNLLMKSYGKNDDTNESVHDEGKSNISQSLEN